MEYSQHQHEAMALYVQAVCNGSMDAISHIAAPAGLDRHTQVMVSIDGLIAAVAAYAEGYGIAPTDEDKQHFADIVRESLLKAMADAREDFAAQAAPTRPH